MSEEKKPDVTGMKVCFTQDGFIEIIDSKGMIRYSHGVANTPRILRKPLKSMVGKIYEKMEKW